MKLFWVFISLCAVFPLKAASFTNVSVQKRQEEYDRYIACLRAREAALHDFTNQRRFRAVIVPRDASIHLDCFVCLSPEAADDVEEMWKPNDSFLGRTVRLLTDKVRKFLANAAEIETPDRTTFAWEFLPLQSYSEWKDAIDLHEPASATARAQKIVSSFIGRDSVAARVGDHFELEVEDANHTKHAGFYRCLRTSKTSRVIEQLHFVDVVTKAVARVRKASPKTLEMGRIVDVADGVEAVWDVSEWTECNGCGEKLGEQRRKIECVVQALPGTSFKQLDAAGMAVLALFASIPCHSSLLPHVVRQRLRSRLTVQEFRSCRFPCALPDNETRHVTEQDERGRERIVDELPPQEFSLAERLPPLRPSVIRRTVRRREENGFVLDCGTVGRRGVLWRKDYRDLTSKHLLKEFPSGNVYIDAEGRLVFLELVRSHAGFYSCWSTSGTVLQRTYQLYVSEANVTSELVGYVKTAIRYITCLLIVVAVTKLILNTTVSCDVHLRAHVRRGPEERLQKEAHSSTSSPAPPN